jgi:CRISPR system Cascade subunit CasA
MTESPELNILTAPIFGVRTASGTIHRWSLAEVLAGLQRGVDLEFTGLQAHQMHAWHAFLCQIGASALLQTGHIATDELDADGWESAVLTLTDGDVAPWCLLVQDLSQPAFMQPPVPEGTLDGFKNSSEQPDLLDLLVTAKNHDIKRRRARKPRPEHWAYTLISLQTTDGFAGRNNYGVARMNGGYGSRAYVSVAQKDEWAVRFQRDIAVLLEQRPALAAQLGSPDRGSQLLLWVPPWNGSTSIELSECDPFFVEICRRVRLECADENAEHIVARFTGTQVPRIAANDCKGDVGDPWIPIRIEDGAALTAKNLSYSVLQMVLFGADYRPSSASMIRDEDGRTPVIVARVLARGKGGTEGYHERILPCSTRARALLGSREGRSTLGSLARLRIEQVAIAKKRMLKPAIATLLQGAPNSINFDDERADRIVQVMESRVDHVFFDSLFSDIERTANEAKRSWEKRLYEFAIGILESAIDGMPIPQARRYRAISAAERVLHGAARRCFPDLFATPGASSDEHQPEHS